MQKRNGGVFVPCPIVCASVQLCDPLNVITDTVNFRLASDIPNRTPRSQENHIVTSVNKNKQKNR